MAIVLKRGWLYQWQICTQRFHSFLSPSFSFLLSIVEINIVFPFFLPSFGSMSGAIYFIALTIAVSFFLFTAFSIIAPVQNHMIKVLISQHWQKEKKRNCFFSLFLLQEKKNGDKRQSNHEIGSRCLFACFALARSMPKSCTSFSHEKYLRMLIELKSSVFRRRYFRRYNVGSIKGLFKVGLCKWRWRRRRFSSVFTPRNFFV